MMGDHRGTDFIMGMIPKDRFLSILDVGCGYGYWGYMLRINLEINPRIIGLELLDENVERLERVAGIYDRVILGDARDYIANEFEGSDISILSHFIEHIGFDDGVKLLNTLKEKCRMIIVLCPDGDARYHSDLPGASHLSAWDSEKMQELGFKTLRVPFSYRAGRVVSLFEKFYFWLRGLNRSGDLVAWWSSEEEQRAHELPV